MFRKYHKLEKEKNARITRKITKEEKWWAGIMDIFTTSKTKRKMENKQEKGNKERY